MLENPYPTVVKDFEANNQQWREITEESYEWYLNCLPPIKYNGNRFMNSELYTYLNTGEGLYLACKEEFGKYYAQLMTLKQYNTMY
ncbi:hypothetical protein [Nostoc sp. MG11]|uniref:hypothetical protein n=1 Tax=Nostoc sp. MG11 TaxID=2721166 RepID=UPI001868793E|nr:hypothetical protein [Nostoc sp. MG11]